MCGELSRPCRRFGSISGLYLLNILSTLPTLLRMQEPKMSPDTATCTPKGQLALPEKHYSSIRTTAALSSAWPKEEKKKDKSWAQFICTLKHLFSNHTPPQVQSWCLQPKIQRLFSLCSPADNEESAYVNTFQVQLIWGGEEGTFLTMHVEVFGSTMK